MLELGMSSLLKKNTISEWTNFFKAYSNIVMYTADPGACAIAELFQPILQRIGNYGGWYVEGWAAQHYPELPLIDKAFKTLGERTTLLLGSQANYKRTQEILAFVKTKNSGSIFVFDHWKNYGEHFRLNLFPDVIVVPDDVARKALIDAIGARCDCRVITKPHVGIEATTTRILHIADRQPGTIAFLLDPTIMSDGLGYDWRTVIMMLPQLVKKYAPEAKVMIKPHPRQSSESVSGWLQSQVMPVDKFALVDIETERLIAMADEVWGMTTIALVAAVHAGKKIRSIQPSRTYKGLKASNHFIEPFIVRE